MITFFHELNGAGQQGLSADPYKLGVTNFSIMQRVFLLQANRASPPAQPVALAEMTRYRRFCRLRDRSLSRFCGWESYKDTGSVSPRWSSTKWATVNVENGASMPRINAFRSSSLANGILAPNGRSVFSWPETKASGSCPQASSGCVALRLRTTPSERRNTSDKSPIIEGLRRTFIGLPLANH